MGPSASAPGARCTEADGRSEEARYVGGTGGGGRCTEPEVQYVKSRSSEVPTSWHQRGRGVGGTVSATERIVPSWEKPIASPGEVPANDRAGFAGFVFGFEMCIAQGLGAGVSKTAAPKRTPMPKPKVPATGQ